MKNVGGKQFRDYQYVSEPAKHLGWILWTFLWAVIFLIFLLIAFQDDPYDFVPYNFYGSYQPSRGSNNILHNFTPPKVGPIRTVS